MIEDTDQRPAATGLFFRNMILLGACLVMFGFFASAGEGFRYTITAPLFDLR